MRTNTAPCTLDLLDELSDCMAGVYYQLREAPPKGSEQDRREAALHDIQEILKWRPLSTFKAEALEMLALLYVHWREQIEIGVGPPDPKGG
jgi:hypothetical protein